MISRFKSGEIDALQFSGVISGISIAEKAGAPSRTSWINPECLR